MILLVLNLEFMDGTVSFLIGFFVCNPMLFYLMYLKTLPWEYGPRGFPKLPKMPMVQTFSL